METTLLLAAFGPAIIAGVFLLPWKPWTNTRGTALQHGAAAIGLVLAFVTSLTLQEGFPDFPPVDAGRWVPFLGLLSLLILALPSVHELDWKGRLLIRFPMVGLMLATIWQPLVSNGTWETSTALVQFSVAGALILLAWELLDSFARKRPGAAFPIAMWIIISGISVTTVLDETLKYGILFGALAATQGAAVVVGIWGKRFQAFGAYGFVLFTLFFAMLATTYAWAYYEPTYDRFLLYFAAMLVAGGFEWVKPLAALPTLKREGLRAGLVAVLVGIAVGIAIAGQGAEDDYGYY